VLYFFRGKHGLQDVGDLNTGSACLICTYVYSIVEHARSASCGHVLFGSCLDAWLCEGKGTYMCRLCHAYVVCGANDCESYDVEQDPTTPPCMSEMLKRVAIRVGLRPLDLRHSFTGLKISNLSLLGHLCCHRHGLRLVHLSSILNKQHSLPR
jgi:hypothetical protein